MFQFHSYLFVQKVTSTLNVKIKQIDVKMLNEFLFFSSIYIVFSIFFLCVSCLNEWNRKRKIFFLLFILCTKKFSWEWKNKIFSHFLLKLRNFHSLKFVEIKILFQSFFQINVKENKFISNRKKKLKLN